MLIGSFADFLLQKLPKNIIFRVWGDRFVIADFEGDMEQLLEDSPLYAEEVEIKIMKITAIPDNLEELMRDKKESF